MARGCGAKRICASKCTKHLSAGDILEVPMFQNATRLWRKAHLQVKMHKTPHSRSHFGSCDVQKLHAAVARSIFISQNVENTTWAEPFWKLRCSKMARRCGAKHICKSKCGKTDGYGPLFGGLMSKNGTPLWREAHLQVKMLKTPAFSSILGRFELTSLLTN